MHAHSDQMISNEKTIALVPTMGFLHQGHLSLMRKALRHADHLVVSIFVNPTQFGPEEDLKLYPKNISKDIELLKKEKVDILFLPDAEELYHEQFQTYISLEKLPSHLCGISRPIHFRGVATIVAKLFNIVKPHIAVFGLKDYQQFIIIKQMVKDLHFNIKIIGTQTAREPDGLAMSSRNTYLTPEQRIFAPTLYKSLNKAQQMLENGNNDSSVIIKAAAELIKAFPESEIDYISICNPETLVDMKKIDRPALMALAVKIGSTRLIDNMILNPPEK